jgi:hypothetical protein
MARQVGTFHLQVYRDKHLISSLDDTVGCISANASMSRFPSQNGKLTIYIVFHINHIHSRLSLYYQALSLITLRLQPPLFSQTHLLLVSHLMKIHHLSIILLLMKSFAHAVVFISIMARIITQHIRYIDINKAKSVKWASLVRLQLLYDTLYLHITCCRSNSFEN